MLSSIRDFKTTGATLLLACLTASCSSLIGGDAGFVVDLGRQVLSPHKVSLTEAASSPYASLGVRVGGSNEIMIVLASDAGGEQLWTSAAHIGITTSNGRVVRTSGLGHDLTGLVAQKRSEGEPHVLATRWLTDIRELNAYNVPLVCQSHPDGDETIQILGKPIQTRRIVEDCRAEARQFIWTFQNTYWIDPDNALVWRSIQHINPKLDALEIEILRPPA